MTTLPNGVTITPENVITGTSKDDRLELDFYTNNLNPAYTSITVYGRDGDDEFDGGNPFINGDNVYSYDSLIYGDFYGEGGDDFFVGRPGGTTEAHGGSGFDEFLSDTGSFITTHMQYSLEADRIIFERPTSSDNQYAKFIVHNDVELLQDFGDNYLIVEELLKGVVRYIDRDQANAYRDSWREGNPTLPPGNQQQTPAATGTNSNTGQTNSDTGAINISGTINNSGTINTGTIDNSVTNIDNSTTIIYNTDNSTNTETSNTDNSVNTSTNNTYTSVSNIQVSLSALMTGSSQGKDVVTGTDGSDTIGAGKGKDKLQGGTGADIFAFSKKDKFGKKGADIITDFKPEEGDKIALSAKALPGLKSAEFGIAANKSELKSLYKSAANIIYYQPKGRLIYDQNGSDKGFGEGGIFSILTGSPEINAGDFGIF